MQRESERASQEAEEEEARYQKTLEKARAEAAAATGTQLEKLTEQIRSLESKVDEAHRKKERAVSRAQLTKSGFVYVISNVGSFGERVVKIGMTRRMEPMERIAELGDASVPFPFDLHAMLYSDNAPALEGALHEFVGEKRVNLVNPRKEFYHNIELDEIERFVRERGLSAQFIKLAEAKEYRETLAIRRQQQERTSESRHDVEKFPPSLFGAAVGTPNAG
ncbi:MAG: GIY-YIG nuclease family protein [Acidobacteria bacterium]|nr:GIY-YIG nuclease family protein [Acidobacteriota bacterium]